MWQVWLLAALMGSISVACIRSIVRHVHRDSAESPLQAASLVGWFWPVFCFRGAVVMFFITSLAYSGLPYAWIYYTVWGFTLQTIYFVWALVDQWHRRSSWGRDVAMDRKLRYLNACFDASVTVSALVSVLFWVAVHPVDPTFVLYWNVYVQHGANVLILLVEFSLNSLTIRWKSVGFVVLFPVLYAVVTWIDHITWHQSWPYFFMDLSSPYAPLWYAAVAAVHVVLHLVMVGLSQIKRTIEPNQCPHHATTADYLPVSPASSDDRA